MKKVTVLLLLLSFLLICCSCDAKVKLNSSDTTNLISIAKKSIIDEKINSEYYTIDTNKDGIETFVQKRDTLQEYISISSTYEKYYSGDMLYYYDKMKNTKTKSMMDFNELKTNSIINDVLSKVKKIFNDSYISSTQGNKWQTILISSSKFVTINFNNNKLIDDGLIEANTSVSLVLSFNSKNEFENVQITFSQGNNKEIYQIGYSVSKTSLRFPDDLEEYKSSG